MKKLLISSVVALGLSSSASLAEESGVFVGVGAGYGVANIKDQYLSQNYSHYIDSKEKGAAYEILAGYKHFITPHLGFRLFANFIYTDAKHKSVNGGSVKANVMSYAINFDALYNFIASSNTNFGVFVGIGAGANTWGGKAFDEIPSNIPTTKTSFDFALNFGLRSVIARHHGIEIAARMPFEEQYIVNDTIPGSNIYMNLRGAYKYNIGARYIYNF
ncbi:outer membrane beta-barrel protein [Helicobacter japonicus]|uniref:outer membrane beta-barrel protein n=1 Tax=Helicobacter japonicus TaxID=425400 RepID=UPI0023F45CDB|nr:outer membrane beta-barrel protein [Helicobacter japonicus]